MSKTIYPTEHHMCQLANPELVPEGTIRQCDHCFTWWFTKWAYQGFGGGNQWYQVRWYHFGKRGRIKNA